MYYDGEKKKKKVTRRMTIESFKVSAIYMYKKQIIMYINT